MPVLFFLRGIIKCFEILKKSSYNVDLRDYFPEFFLSSLFKTKVDLLQLFVGIFSANYLLSFKEMYRRNLGNFLISVKFCTRFAIKIAPLQSPVG